MNLLLSVTQLAELWPNGYMDNVGIKDAIYRARERKKAFYRHQVQPLYTYAFEHALNRVLYAPRRCSNPTLSHFFWENCGISFNFHLRRSYNPQFFIFLWQSLNSVHSYALKSPLMNIFIRACHIFLEICLTRIPGVNPTVIGKNSLRIIVLMDHVPLFFLGPSHSFFFWHLHPPITIYLGKSRNHQDDKASSSSSAAARTGISQLCIWSSGPQNVIFHICPPWLAYFISDDSRTYVMMNGKWCPPAPGSCLF